MSALTRITTEYVTTEDRLRISGERSGAPQLTIWLTQRLLLRLLPPLFKWLETTGAGGRPRSETLQSFAQQTARAQQTPQPPVAYSAAAESWLVETLDLNTAAAAVRLIFKSGDGQQVILTLTDQALRQWLNILHSLWVKAEWPLAVWPEWVQPCAGAPQQPVVIH